MMGVSNVIVLSTIVVYSYMICYVFIYVHCFSLCSMFLKKLLCNEMHQIETL